MNARPSLFGNNIKQVQQLLTTFALPSYTARQIAHWLYRRHVYDFAQMTDLAKSTRQLLAENFQVGIVAPQKTLQAKDGTKKYLFPVAAGLVETALIPADKRCTLCVSTQVGCQRGCIFCLTGQQQWQGNLSAREILNQYAAIPERDRVTNIVYMGMGEPLDNLENVIASLNILTDARGYAKSPARITVSTVGLPNLATLIDGCRCHLAISLHSPFSKQRQQLVPAEKIMALPRLIALLKNYDWSGQRRLTFEYIVFNNYNHSPRHVNELACLLNGLSCRINLLQYHEIGSNWQRADPETIQRFQQDLQAKGLLTTIRQSRGLEIGAACGLLSTHGPTGKDNMDLNPDKHGDHS